MAANDYYTSHPQNTTNPPPTAPYHWNVPSNLAATNTSYEPYRQDALSQPQQPQAYPLTMPTGPIDLSTTHLSTSLPSDTSSSSSSSTTDRSLFSSSFSSSSAKKSKSERAIKFMEKQVRKQIEKKLNGSGGGGHGGQQAEEYASQEVGQQQDQSGGWGEYGYGSAEGGYGPVGDFGSGEGGNFDWAGESAGWFGDLDLGGLGDVLGE
ncbi:Nn.00g095970.m01.CDS01 [Neocucurbitaria sp. VM-36]